MSKKPARPSRVLSAVEIRDVVISVLYFARRLELGEKEVAGPGAPMSVRHRRFFRKEEMALLRKISHRVKKRMKAQDADELSHTTGQMVPVMTGIMKRAREIASTEGWAEAMEQIEDEVAQLFWDVGGVALKEGTIQRCLGSIKDETFKKLKGPQGVAIDLLGKLTEVSGGTTRTRVKEWSKGNSPAPPALIETDDLDIMALIPKLTCYFLDMVELADAPTTGDHLSRQLRALESAAERVRQKKAAEDEMLARFEAVATAPAKKPARKIPKRKR